MSVIEASTAQVTCAEIAVHVVKLNDKKTLSNNLFNQIPEIKHIGVLATDGWQVWGWSTTTRGDFFLLVSPEGVLQRAPKFNVLKATVTAEFKEALKDFVAKAKASPQIYLYA